MYHRHVHQCGEPAEVPPRQHHTWPRVLLAAQAASMDSWRAGRQHCRGYWASTCNPAAHIAASAAFRCRTRVVIPLFSTGGGQLAPPPAPAGADKECAPDALVILPKTCSRLNTSSTYASQTASEGESSQLKHSDPRQPASGRRQHPTVRRWGEVERARVTAMRAMQLPEIRSPASTQLANSARRPPEVKRWVDRRHGHFC